MPWSRVSVCDACVIQAHLVLLSSYPELPLRPSPPSVTPCWCLFYCYCARAHWHWRRALRLKV
eukprot:scaffold119900_cov49-Tisochrysis_lutea.AAC.1